MVRSESDIRKGWAFVHFGHRAHYFLDKTESSLCGKYLHRRWAKGSEQDAANMDCAECRELMRKLP